ncbi:MAG: tetratricopeptide repeat protein, partial [Cypionkella sp.]
LAKNEAQIGNYVASRVAFQHMVQLKADTATLNDHLGLAQTMIIAAGGFVSPEAEQQLIIVLQTDPKNGLARYFSGLMFAQVGRFDRAFALWEPLLRESPADAPWMDPIRAGLQDVADRAGIKYQLPDARGPSAGDVAAAGDMSPADRQQMIQGMVAQLEARLSTDGGPVADWLKLINALGVLGESDRAKTATDQAKSAHPEAASDLDAALAALPKGPSAADVANAATMTPADRQSMIRGMVDQLETRLTTDGGPLDDWLKLMSSLMVLGDKPRATAAYEKAAAAFANDTDALGKIEETASTAGITP